MLLFLVPADSADHAKEYAILLAELDKYNPDLIGKQRLLAISKSDILDAELREEISATLPPKVPHLFFSSVSGENLQELKDLLWVALNN